MPIFAPFHPGTITLTNGSTAIVGTGTDFTVYPAGSLLTIPGVGSVQIAEDPTDPEAATASTAWQGATIAGAPYDWTPPAPGAVLNERTRTLVEMLASGNLAAEADLDAAADEISYYTGTGTKALAAFTEAARALLDDADAAAMRATLGVPFSAIADQAEAEAGTDDAKGMTPLRTSQAFLKFWNHVSIADFGALADGSDATTAIQSAINAAIADYKTVLIPRVPAGDAFRTTSPLVISEGVIVEGQGAQPYTQISGVGPERGRLYRGAGSWLHFDHAGDGIVCAGTASGMSGAGVIIDQIGTMRTLDVPGAGWTAPDIGYDIAVATPSGSFGDVLIRDVMMLNAPKGVRIDYASERVVIERLSGQFMRIGIYVDGATDVVRIHDFHNWPYWSGDANVRSFTIANLIDLYMGRADNPQVDGIFSIYHNIGILLANGITSLAGAPAKAKFSNCDFDVGNNPILITADWCTADFINITSQGELGTGIGGPGLLITGSNNRVRMGAMRSTISYSNAVRVEGTGNHVVLYGGFRADQFDQGNAGGTAAFAAIYAAAGNDVVIDGSYELFPAASTLLSFDGAGNIGRPPATYLPLGSVSAPSVAGVGDPDTGLYFGGANSLSLVTGAADRLVIDSGGRVITPYRPSFSATKSASVSAAIVTGYDAVLHNVGSHFNAATGIFTAPVAGKYHFDASIINAASPANIRIVFAKNGVEVGPAAFTSAANEVMHLGSTLDLAANDTVYLYISAGTSQAGALYNTFSGFLVG